MAAGVRPKKIGKVNLFKIDWTGKDKKETSPTYNISGEIDGIGEIGGAGWVSKTKAGETYLSCNINAPFQKDGQAQSSSVKDDELPF